LARQTKQRDGFDCTGRSGFDGSSATAAVAEVAVATSAATLAVSKEADDDDDDDDGASSAVGNAVFLSLLVVAGSTDVSVLAVSATAVVEVTIKEKNQSAMLSKRGKKRLECPRRFHQQLQVNIPSAVGVLVAVVSLLASSCCFCVSLKHLEHMF